MKSWIMAALAGCGCAWILSPGSLAAPVLTVVSQNTTDTFLTTNNLQSAVIGVTGFAPGENLQGFAGVTGNPWIVTSSSGAFFNIRSDSGATFYGGGQMVPPTGYPAPNAAFDSGVMTSAYQLGSIIAATTQAFGFAQFNLGQNSGPGNDVVWVTLDPHGIAVPTVLNLFRLTWSRSGSATVRMLAITNTGGGNGFEYPVSLTIPAVPAPGTLAFISFAAIVTRRRRRG